MSILRILRFECKMQLKSLTFIAVLILFTVFAITQLNEVFHLPIMSDRDIQALSVMSPDTSHYVYAANTNDTEVKELSYEFLQQQLNENSFSQNVISELQVVIEMLQNESYSFDEVLTATADYEYAPDWLLSCKSQFSQRLATVEEANQNIQAALGDRGYAPMFYKNYLTYMQAILAFLIFPIFLLVLIKDYRHGVFEIVYAQPTKPSKYLLCKYLSIFIPVSVYLYLFGVVLNLISACRFMMAGLEYQYTFFAPFFLLYLLPALFFMSAVIMVLTLLIKKAVAVLPVYMIYVLLNVTPGVFAFDKDNTDWLYIINPIIRLDHEIAFNTTSILLNRSIYMFLGGVLIMAACLLYKKMRKNMRGAISL